MVRYHFFVVVMGTVLFGCKDQDTLPSIIEIGAPSVVAAEPNLFTSETGDVYLSWIARQDTVYSLQYSMLSEEGWNQPSTIAGGVDWFVNWADFPSLVSTTEGSHLAAHWLEMSAEGTYDYDIRIVQSNDGGRSWSDPFTIHTDGIAAEHGFVSLLPLGDGRVFASWLDGRKTKSDVSADKAIHQHGTGSMTLRSATFDHSGRLYDEAELDSRVCECCQTSAALTTEGPIVVYRDRSEREVRDIAMVRKVGGQWTEPKVIYEDNWLIYGCPVNGPVARTSGSNVAVAWFAMRDSIPEVKVIFSKDNGEEFGNPFLLDLGDPMGRVDLLWLDDNHVGVTWLEKVGDKGILYLRQVHLNGHLSEPYEIAEMNLSRRSGFPRVTDHGADLVVAWTDVDSVTRIKTVKLKM